MAGGFGVAAAAALADVGVTAALIEGLAGCKSGDAESAFGLESLVELVAVAELLAESLRGCGFLSSAKLGSANKNIAVERMAARSSDRMSIS